MKAVIAMIWLVIGLSIGQALAEETPDDSAITFSASEGTDEMYRIEIPKLIFSIKADGTVVLGEGVTWDEATMAFWNHVGTRAPCAAETRALEKLGKETIERLEGK